MTTDPRSSGRPSEALRLGAGLAAGRRVAVTVYLHGPAIRMLGETVDDLVDAEYLEEHWSILRAAGNPVWVEKEAVELANLSHPRLPFREAGPDQLARILAPATYVLRF